MTKCSRCKGNKIAGVFSKSPDGTRWSFGEHEEEGIPLGVGVGDGEYTQFTYCLDCGQIQGDWPCPKRAIKKAEEDAEKARKRQARLEKERARREEKDRKYREWLETEEGQKKHAAQMERVGDTILAGMRMAELVPKEESKTITTAERVELEGLRAQILQG